MTLKEMAKSYRDGALACRIRCRELAEAMTRPHTSKTKEVIIRRRRTVLESMARDAIEIAKHLENTARRCEA